MPSKPSATKPIPINMTANTPFRPAVDLEHYRPQLTAVLRRIIDHVSAHAVLSRKDLEQILRAYRKDEGEYFRNDDLISAYRAFAGSNGLPAFDERVLQKLRIKPIRSASGVAVVTVLTKPFPCPGECIFCPNDVRMPKSYLSDEPGAQRAELNAFDPYLQTYTRLSALHKIGHPTDKIEVIILGGTWSFYPETYQIWFVKRIFDALHDFGRTEDHSDEVKRLLTTGSQFQPDTQAHDLDVHLHGVQVENGDVSYNATVQSIYRQEMDRSRGEAARAESGLSERTAITEYATWAELETAHQENETAPCRCVGLVVETRPDHISEAEVIRIRRLGCTKVQIGFQSLNDEVLQLNRRGHSVGATRRAVRLLRRAGFKIHAHWMPNLYGSSPEADIADYEKMFSDPDFRPDELKIYPCSLIESAALMDYYRDGRWRPYTHDELVSVLSASLQNTPPYVRLTRIVRDIPGTDIVVGNKVTNLRQLVEDRLRQDGKQSRDIRAREIGAVQVDPELLRLETLEYSTSAGRELFLQWVTPEDRICGFARLSLPNSSDPPLVVELENCAMIREVHVYGQALGIGEMASGRAQHAGLGTKLLEHAAHIAREAGYATLAVISAIGTRGYYRSRGFTDGTLYQHRLL